MVLNEKHFWSYGQSDEWDKELKESKVSLPILQKDQWTRGRRVITLEKINSEFLVVYSWIALTENENPFNKNLNRFPNFEDAIIASIGWVNKDMKNRELVIKSSLMQNEVKRPINEYIELIGYKIHARGDPTHG